MNVKDLIEARKNSIIPLREEESALIEKAYDFSQKAHRNQKRQSGEPYFTHAFETALKVSQWQLDAATIAAALLHDVIEDGATNIENIKKEFAAPLKPGEPPSIERGEEIAFLIDSVTKLGKLKYRGAERQAESLRKMILALSKDLRVVFIKLADRLHNMQTLSAVSIHKQKRISMETAEIYAPLASRLGMQAIASELENLSFPYAHPQEYQWLINNMKEKYEEQERYLEKVKELTQKILKENRIEPIKIDARAKRLSSLYKKLLRHDMNLERVYDLVALRIIVKTIEECYASLGVIHHFWPPLPGRIKDYIALPKPNGYRSLHTTVFCLDNKPTEFQIRTQEMHDEAENGIAAYWAYTQAKTSKTYREAKPIFAEKKELAWIQQLKDWQKEITGSEEFLESLKIDFFKDRIFAITPKGEVLDLPVGSTPVDFAYAIHTEIGDQCVGAKVNNKIVSLNYQLQSGDLVEILIQKSKKPSKSWLEFVKTSQAKHKIKSALRQYSFKARTLKNLHMEFKIIAKDRIGLLKDISALISRSHINITQVSQPQVSHFMTVRIKCAISDKEKIEKLVLKIRSVDGVKEVSYKLVS